MSSFSICNYHPYSLFPSVWSQFTSAYYSNPIILILSTHVVYAIKFSSLIDMVRTSTTCPKHTCRIVGRWHLSLFCAPTCSGYHSYAMWLHLKVTNMPRLAGTFIPCLALGTCLAPPQWAPPPGHAHSMLPWGFTYTISITILAIEAASGLTCLGSVISPDQLWSQTRVPLRCIQRRACVLDQQHSSVNISHVACSTC